MALYAAYGSNMDPSQMLQRCPSSPLAGTGWLPGWRLTFGGEDLGWEGALATIVQNDDQATAGGSATGRISAPDTSRDSSVFVVLYDMSDADERSLDSWEGADLGVYNKIRLRVHTPEGARLAWLYVLDAFEGGLPSARYLGVLAEAAERAGAPPDYVTDLRIRPCR